MEGNSYLVSNIFTVLNDETDIQITLMVFSGHFVCRNGNDQTERRNSMPDHLDGVFGFSRCAPDVGLDPMPYDVGLEPFAASSEQ